jgi:hypothetical protein
MVLVGCTLLTFFLLGDDHSALPLGGTISILCLTVMILTMRGTRAVRVVSTLCPPASLSLSKLV